MAEPASSPAAPEPSSSAPPEPSSASPEPSAPSVSCDELVVRYGDLVAVDHLSFVAGPGQVVALLGPNGAGKTSTVEVLEGYRRPAAGTAQVLGLDPHRDHAALVERIGVMLQRGGVYPMLGSAQVLHLFARYYEDPEDPDELLHRVGLAGVARTPWRRLSGGEQQRLSLALALVGKPSVLFLDEPTAGVDPEGRLAVRDIVAAQRDRGVCVVLTTHELDEAERIADHVIIVDRGRKLAEGTPTELAAGTRDPSIRFTTDAGIDTASLEGALGAGASVTEERPGNYRLTVPGGDSPSPAAIAALTGWLADRDLSLGGLQTRASLEEAYLAITGSGKDPGAAGVSDSSASAPPPASVPPSAPNSEEGDGAGEGRSGRGAHRKEWRGLRIGGARRARP